MIADRLDALEQRVAALEAAQPAPPPAVARAESDRFWVLEGLRPQVSGAGAVLYAGVVETEAGPVEWQYAHATDDLIGADDDDAGVDRFAAAAAGLAALGHPARLAILAAVLRGHTRTSDLPDHLDLGTSGQIYHHVKALTAAGWLRAAGRGHLAVPPQRVVPLLVAIGVNS